MDEIFYVVMLLALSATFYLLYQEKMEIRALKERLDNINVV